MKMVSASAARANWGRLIDDVAASNEPVCIKGKRGKVVLLSEYAWRSVNETLCLVSMPGMRESILMGLGMPLSLCSEESCLE